MINLGHFWAYRSFKVSIFRGKILHYKFSIYKASFGYYRRGLKMISKGKIDFFDFFRFFRIFPLYFTWNSIQSRKRPSEGLNEVKNSWKKIRMVFTLVVHCGKKARVIWEKNVFLGHPTPQWLKKVFQIDSILQLSDNRSFTMVEENFENSTAQTPPEWLKF